MLSSLLSFLPKVIGGLGGVVASYATKKPGETNVMGYLTLAAGAYFGVDGNQIAGVLRSIAEMIDKTP